MLGRRASSLTWSNSPPYWDSRGSESRSRRLPLMNSAPNLLDRYTDIFSVPGKIKLPPAVAVHVLEVYPEANEINMRK